MSLALLFSVFPVLFLYYIRSGNYYFFHLSALYLFPLIVATMLSSEIALPGAAMSVASANIIRVGAHALFLGGAIVALLMSDRPKRTPIDTSLVVIGLTTIFSVALSIFVTGTATSFEQIARLILLTMMLMNLFLFHPILIKKFGPRSLKIFSDYLIIICVWIGLLSVVSIAIYGNLPDWQTRLGRPLNPGVFSAFQTIAFVLCLLQKRHPGLALFFLVMIIASGSRTALATVLVALFLRYRHHRALMMVVSGPVIVGVLWTSWTTLVGEFAGSDLFGRTDWSSGRVVDWLRAVALVPDYWMFGTGERFLLFVDLNAYAESRLQRLHNGFLEGLLSYGILYALSMLSLYVYAAYRSFGGFRGRKGIDPNTQMILRAILVYVFIEWMFGTMYWTNLGDGFSFILLTIFPVLFLVPADRFGGQSWRTSNQAAEHHIRPKSEPAE